ncbi:homoserine dehydrogenase [Clostridium sp. 'White wine YQ']|uniref:homoserine dehydrogenase n=1 Tax=Clostridium sp. 'White wine YQ' TaxID=3027474 RepID=UPI0023670BAE|nr:homoserine dehydrogenase [Clostridium sp. 'White wine YQ']MDD7796098.1 homoserine dehydrogenase [Clostridium sp. 'White wine YQ']
MNLVLIGYGGVGKAFIKLLKDKHEKLKSEGLDIKVRGILNSKGGVLSSNPLDLMEVLNAGSLENNKNWRAGINYRDVLTKEKCDLMVELTQTNKETGEPGLTHIKYALENNINVVTGNKGPILVDYEGLKRISEEKGVALGVGCTTGGALPSLNCGLMDLAGANIEKVEGILNGTSNFILEEMESGLSFNEGLEKAQRLGIAEKDPTLDIEGHDTAIKMLILSKVVLKKNININEVKIKGITAVSKEDILKAKNEGKRYKLVGRIECKGNEVNIEVSPMRIEKEDMLFNINGRNKGVKYYTDTLGEVAVIGGASGTTNAAASILRDIINIHNGYKF